VGKSGCPCTDGSRAWGKQRNF